MRIAELLHRTAIAVGMIAQKSMSGGSVVESDAAVAAANILGLMFPGFGPCFRWVVGYSSGAIGG